MTARELRLTAAVAAAGALWAGSQGLSRYRAALDENQSQELAATEALSTARLAAYRGQKARKQVVAWRRQSLPADVDVAESLYRDWLAGELKGAGINDAAIADRARGVAGEGAAELMFTVTGKGALPQWLDFFKRFSQAPHLHRISEASLAPTEDKQQLAATLRVDALALADSPRKKELASPQTEDAKAKEARAAMETLVAAITGRNPFQPPAPKAGGDPGNLAAKAKVTFLFGGQDGWLVDVRREDTGAVERFAAGDTVHFGSFEAKLVELDGRRVVYETKEGKFEVRLGQTFGEGQKVEAQGAGAAS